MSKAKFAALDADGWLEFTANKSPKCPHCGDDFHIADNEAWFLYDENDTHEVECPSCEETFQVSSSASWCFSTDEQER
ncbi:hypothetical protein [Rhizobium aethiopicum]|uniref:Putative Zn-finger protein n=1 Tax=Rhizobium aethiopicum TaxID=1138170 RepID=A0A7W6MHH9_9HYPH|nr:hypothetical protein [Rhizobium aethiopicum]MBB4192824.1 putative Zn-finger protein [Rhizobium aethiopicum]